MYILFNKAGERVGQLTNNGGPGSAPFWNDVIRQQIADDDSELTLDDAGSGLYSEFNNTDEHANTKNYSHVLESICIPYGYPETDEFVEYARLVYQDKSNRHWYEMILTEVRDEQTESGEWYKSAIGVNTFQWDLGHLNCLDKTYNSTDAKTVMNDLLGNSGWTLGEVDGSGTSQYEWSTEKTSNRQSVIQSLCQQFDVELDAYILFNSAGQIAQRKVDVLHHIGTDAGVVLYTGGNITSIERTVSADNLYTRLVVLGKNGETIESVNGGLTYIQDTDANDKYNPGGGFLEGVIQSQTIANKNALLTWAKKQLEYFNHPKTNYSVTGEIDAGLGDTVRIQALDAHPQLGATSRVIQKVTSQSDPSQNQSLVGEFATVKIMTPSLIASLRSEFSVDVNDLLAAVEKDASALSVHLFTPDGTDFSLNDSQKRVIGQVFINNKNVTEYVDSKGWKWNANQVDGTVNTDFNSRYDTAGMGYLQVVDNDFHGTLNVAIDTAYINADPSYTTSGLVLSKLSSDNSDTSSIADIAYSDPNDAVYKLTESGEIWEVGTTNFMTVTGLGEKVISTHGAQLYLMSSDGKLVATNFNPGASFDTTAAQSLGQFGQGTAVKYDEVNDLYITKYGNTLSVYTRQASGELSPAPIYQLPDYHSIGFDNNIVSWTINYPRVYAVTDAHTLIGFNIINQSPLFEWEPVSSGGLFGTGLSHVAMNDDNLMLTTLEGPNLVQTLELVPRGNALVTENPVTPIVLTDEEKTEMQRVKDTVAGLTQPDSFAFGWITDSHLQQNGTQAQRRSVRHLKTIAKYVKDNELPLLVHGGDLIDGKVNRTQAMQDTRAGVVALETATKPMIIVNGNHDDNSGYVKDVLNMQYAGILPFADRFNPEFSHSAIKVNPDDKTNPYGYYVAKENLWIVVINAFDFPYLVMPDGKSKYKPHSRSAFRIGQLKWLDNLLCSVPATTQVMFISHSNLRGVSESPFAKHARNGNLMTDMIIAFNNSGHFNEEDGLSWDFDKDVSEVENNNDFKTSLSVNYDLNPTGRVVGVIVGHTHADRSYTYKGVNFVETLCSAYDRGQLLNWERTGINEDAWDIVTVSPTNRTFDMVRYGAGRERVRHFNY